MCARKLVLLRRRGMLPQCARIGKCGLHLVRRVHALQGPLRRVWAQSRARSLVVFQPAIARQDPAPVGRLAVR